MTTSGETPDRSAEPRPSSLAHDLRGRLNSIVCCVRVLRGGRIELGEALDVIEHNAQEMAALLRAAAREPAQS